MGKETGFLEYEREDRTYADPAERLKTYKEFVIPHERGALQKQAARCMNCGIPYCHNGCPVNNIIPDWNHLVYEDDWKSALEVLHSTNNFPEFTGRVCPAPCEAACTLNIVDAPVTIKSIECAIIDRGFKEGWVKPQVPEKQTGKSVAVIGSGPAGLACAQQLARAGHAVTVFEKSDRIGGLLRYGIPDFKMEKHLINRRAVQMEAEGVQFKTGAEVGVEVSFAALKENFDAVVLAGGAEDARKLDVPGAELPGVRLAMEFLTQQNKRNAGDDEVRAAPRGSLTATGKDVIVIGGGDTGSDCVGTSNRRLCTLKVLPGLSDLLLCLLQFLLLLEEFLVGSVENSSGVFRTFMQFIRGFAELLTLQQVFKQFDFSLNTLMFTHLFFVREMQVANASLDLVALVDLLFQSLNFLVLLSLFVHHFDKWRIFAGAPLAGLPGEDAIDIGIQSIQKCRYFRCLGKNAQFRGKPAAPRISFITIKACGEELDNTVLRAQECGDEITLWQFTRPPFASRFRNSPVEHRPQPAIDIASLSFLDDASLGGEAIQTRLGM